CPAALRKLAGQRSLAPAAWTAGSPLPLLPRTQLELAATTPFLARTPPKRQRSGAVHAPGGISGVPAFAPAAWTAGSPLPLLPRTQLELAATTPFLARTPPKRQKSGAVHAPGGVSGAPAFAPAAWTAG